MSKDITHRHTGAVLYGSATADTIAEAVIEAVRNGANLDRANLDRANLSGANLSGASLDGANLSGANLSGANLDRANLSEASLDGASLSGASLSGANLDRASLDGANLDRANLSGASLSGANLSGANLSEASLDGANLSGANLDGANLSGNTKIDCVAITIVGSRHVVTAYADRVRIGCHERGYESWLKIYERVGREEGYTDKQIEEYHQIILRAQAMFAVLNTGKEKP